MQYLVVVLVIALTVVGDVFLKKGSMVTGNPYWNWLSMMGALMYFLSAFGWIYMMGRMNLAVVGVVYACMTIIILTTLGVVFFKELLTMRQLVGVLFAIAAVIITMEPTAK